MAGSFMDFATLGDGAAGALVEVGGSKPIMMSSWKERASAVRPYFYIDGFRVALPELDGISGRAEVMCELAGTLHCLAVPADLAAMVGFWRIPIAGLFVSPLLRGSELESVVEILLPWVDRKGEAFFGFQTKRMLDAREELMKAFSKKELPELFVQELVTPPGLLVRMEEK